MLVYVYINVDIEDVSARLCYNVDIEDVSARLCQCRH
jgi:hypothetical protein